MGTRFKKIFLPTILNTLNTKWSNNMGKLSQLKKILTVFLAGFVLLISTACSSMNSPQASRENVNPRANVQKLTEDPDYDYYDANQPKQGGMNKYNDDPRLEDSKLQKKVDKLVKGAKANIEERNDDTARFLDDKISKTGRNLDDAKDDVSQKIGNLKEDIPQGAKDRIDKTKNNIEKISKSIRQTGEETSNTLKDNLDNRNKVTK
jgi:gas vesicle protein